eukprot:g13138.t1
MARQMICTSVRVAALLAVEELCTEERCRTRKAVRQVAQLYADAEEEVRRTAQRVMCSIGRERRCAIDALTQVLTSPNEKARSLAAETFRSVVGRLEQRAMARTMRLLAGTRSGSASLSSDSTVGELKRMAQQSLGVRLRSLLSAAGKLLTDTNKSLKEEGHYWCWMVGGKQQSLVPTVVT